LFEAFFSTKRKQTQTKQKLNPQTQKCFGLIL